MAVTIMASAGSFAAISTLLGSPLLGAFLIMEAAGIAGATLTLVALPGLLASGVGALVFIGLDSWTGLGTFSLALTTVPPEVTPTVATLLWALPVGARRRPHRLGDPLGRALAASARPREPGPGHRRPRPARRAQRDALPARHRATASPHVLFSGQDALPELVADAADYSVGVLVVLGRLQGAAYGLSLSAFRGGPVFPAMFVGAVLGMAVSGLPGHGPRTGDRDGDRRAVLRDAAAAADLDPPGHPPARQRRPVGDAAGVVAVVVAFVVITVLPDPAGSPRVGEPQPSAPPDSGG